MYVYYKPTSLCVLFVHRNCIYVRRIAYVLLYVCMYAVRIVHHVCVRVCMCVLVCLSV